jgi:hypothetical protein
LAQQAQKKPRFQPPIYRIKIQKIEPAKQKIKSENLKKLIQAEGRGREKSKEEIYKIKEENFKKGRKKRGKSLGNEGASGLRRAGCSRGLGLFPPVNLNSSCYIVS